MGTYLEANEVEVMVHSLRRQNIARRAKRSNKGSYRACPKTLTVVTEDGEKVRAKEYKSSLWKSQG